MDPGNDSIANVYVDDAGGGQRLVGPVWPRNRP